MSILKIVGIALGIIGPIIAGASWLFGVYDARRDVNQALYLDAALRESGFVSNIRYRVYFAFNADPDYRVKEFNDETALEVAVERRNHSAMDALLPRVSEDTFLAVLSKACAENDQAGISLLFKKRYPVARPFEGDACLEYIGYWQREGVEKWR